MEASKQLFLFAIALVQLYSGNAAKKQYYEIKKNIRATSLKGYDKVVGPSSQGRQKAKKVWFALKIKKLSEISTKDQYLKIKAVVKMEWFDKFLKWDMKKHGGISYVQYMTNEIWTPDVALINNEDDDRDRKQKAHRLTVRQNGRVKWRFPTTLVSSCALDVTKWPMDTQKCTLTFGSSVYTKRRLKIIGVNRTHKASISSGEWSLKSIEMYRGFYDHGDNLNHSTINYKLILDRKPAYTLFYLSPPSLILALLTFMSFFIPSESGERIGFVTTILLTMMVFLLLLPDYLPRTSDELPVLGIMLILAMIFIAFVLIATIVVVKLYHSTGIPPFWIQKVFCSSNSSFKNLSLGSTFKKLRFPLPIFNYDKLHRKAVSGLPFTITQNEVELESIPPPSFEPNAAVDEDAKKITWQELSEKLNWFLFVFLLCSFALACCSVYYRRRR